MIPGMDIVNTRIRDARQRRRMLVVVGIGFAACLVAAGAAWIGPPRPSVDGDNLWIGTVRKGAMLQEVRAAGTLVPREMRWIAASTPAQVEKIEALPGTRVHPDTVLMTLSNPEVEDNLRNAEAAVAAAEAEAGAKRAELQSRLLDHKAALAQAKAELASAKVKAKADTEAAKLKLIAQVQFQQSLIALDQLESRVDIEERRVRSFARNMAAQAEAVEAHVRQQRSNLLLRQRQADALKVKAGIEGVLQEVAVQEGARVGAGANLARVARPDVLLARLQVPEALAKDIALSMLVEVETHNGVVNGKVERIDPAVRDGTVQVDVALTGKVPRDARPDLSVNGTIRIARLDDVLSVERPADAAPHAEMTLFRLDPDGDSAERVEVRTGAASFDRMQIERGLVAGDRIILSDVSRWRDYDQLEIN